MNKYYVGRPVLIQHHDELIEGKIRSSFDSASPPLYYWVDYEVFGHHNCALYPVEDLDQWNATPYKATTGCECGGEAVGATRHPHYCPLFRQHE